MYCPKCGATQNDEMRFCNLCGANLSAVRQAVETGQAGEKVDWGKTWLTGMFLSKEEQQKRRHELERQLGITPEVKRQNEIKGGIITSCVGVGLMIFLFIMSEGLIRGIDLPPVAVEILRRAWAAGVIPFFVGIGLMINGLVISKRPGKDGGHEPASRPDALRSDTEHPSLRSADTTEFITPGFSVTEDTTKHLRNSGEKQ